MNEFELTVVRLDKDKTWYELNLENRPLLHRLGMAKDAIFGDSFHFRLKDIDYVDLRKIPR